MFLDLKMSTDDCVVFRKTNAYALTVYKKLNSLILAK